MRPCQMRTKPPDLGGSVEKPWLVPKTLLRAMSAPEPVPQSKRARRSVVRAVRLALSAGFAIVVADLASLLVSPDYRWLVFGCLGGSLFVAYWWCWGRVFRNVGLAAK